jgi:hypothetical protein
MFQNVPKTFQMHDFDDPAGFQPPDGVRHGNQSRRLGDSAQGEPLRRWSSKLKESSGTSLFANVSANCRPRPAADGPARRQAASTLR